MSGRAVIEFSPAYRRYTPEVSDSLMRISAALGRIQGARVLPAVADQLRASARVGTVHFSNLIEGNQLPVIDAERAARGELAGDSRAKIELVNYVEALDLIDRRLDTRLLALTPEFLLEIHGATTRGLGRDDDPHFNPHHEGAWRDGQAVVYDHLAGRVMHEGPPPEEVGPRMNGMFEWVNRRLDAGDPPFVIAGVLHYGITDVHPFADGNGRVARLAQIALLMGAGVLPGRMFSFERYYADDRMAYYAALRSVRLRTLNMEFWLDYFLKGLAEEYERVAAAVVDLSALMPGGTGAPLRLTAGQERGLTALRIQGRREFSRREYEQAAGVGRSTAGQDLRALVRHGVLATRGAGPHIRYVFSGLVEAAERPSRRGRPTKWTDAVIEQELRAFVDGRSEWPTPGEFRAAGQGALYAAAAKAGGVARWRRVVGL
ncbi:MAG TPA: Fic family protein [Solirubrobacter sp.]|nr:Fic family protein [Solirubrobacter sp.]